jgi:hypothetical protein
VKVRVQFVAKNFFEKTVEMPAARFNELCRQFDKMGGMERAKAETALFDECGFDLREPNWSDDADLEDFEAAE